jgi:hypothetical protein
MKGKRILLAAGAALALGFAAPGAAFGQGKTWPGLALAQIVETTMWRLGDLRVNAALEVGEAGYNSDIYYGFFGDPVPDATFTVSVPAQVIFPVSRRLILDLYDTPSYDFYVNTKRERGWNNAFVGFAHLALNRFYLRGGGELSNIRRRMSLELDVPIREKADSLDGFVLWQASRATSMALAYRGTAFDYGDAEYLGTSLSETLNRKEEAFDLYGYIQPSPRFHFYVDGRYGTYVFASAAASFKDARSYSIFGGFSSLIRAATTGRAGAISGSARLGYTRFDVRDVAQVDGSGLTGEVDLSIGILKLTTATVHFARGFQFSVLAGATYYLQTSYGAGISRLLSKRTSVSYDFLLGRTTYPGTEADAGASPGSLIRFATHSLKLSVLLKRNLSVVFAGTLGRRVLDTTGQRWNQDFFGFSLVYGAPMAMISAPGGGLSR